MVKDEYYNSEVKQRYINILMEKAAEKKIPLDDYNRMQRFDGSFFKLSLTFEKNLKKDLCNFSPQDIINYYTSIASPSLNYLSRLNSWYKTYTEWAISERITISDNNYFKMMNLEIISGCLASDRLADSMITREMLNDLAKTQAGDNLCDLGMAYLLFEGIKGYRFDDILNLTYDNLIPEKNIVVTMSGEKKISPECMQVLMKASKDDYYVLKNGKPMPFLDRKIVRSYRKDQMSVDDNSKTNKESITRFRRRVKTYFEAIGLEEADLSAVIEWGRVDYIKRLLKENKIEPEKYLDYLLKKDVKKKLSEQFGVVAFDPRKFYENYKQYIVD